MRWFTADVSNTSGQAVRQQRPPTIEITMKLRMKPKMPTSVENRSVNT